MPEHKVPDDRLTANGLSLLAKLLNPADESPEANYLRSGEGNNAVVDGLLRTLAAELQLNRIELLAVALAIAVETDIMCGRGIARLQTPIGASRPTLGLLAAAFRDFGSSAEIISSLLTGPAAESGLLRIGSEGTPLAERPVSVPVPVCLALNETASARETAWPGTTPAVPASSDVPLAASVAAKAARHAAALSVSGRHALLVRSGSLAEAKAVAAEIARYLGRRALFVDGDKNRASDAMLGLVPYAILTGVVPVFCFEPAPGEHKSLPDLPRFNAPRIAVCGLEGSLEWNQNTIPGWTIEVATRAERVRLWESAVGSRSLARVLASRRHGSGRISQLGHLANHRKALSGRSRTLLKDVVEASWTPEGGGIEALAQPIPESVSDDAFVMTPGLRDELHRLLLRCREREDLVSGLGPSASVKYRPGVRALFTGGSGTGKTLAAAWLATRLGLPLYRVDLAAVTSKYIGETEKNLAQLLGRAESGEVILLFDEADSMFGKRTDIKESNDRFANAQTNYLLQRIERYDGIVFLTSNHRARFDPAFFRRLDVIIDFPVPGPAERRSLWQSHLGENHRLTHRELNQLSAAADLVGGNIRNAVLTAAMLARSKNTPVAYPDLLQALADEYRKLGRQLPHELQQSA